MCADPSAPAYPAISIHAPLTGSDLYKLSLFRGLQHFNPRSPYGERLVSAVRSIISVDFNPRSPYGERH